MQKGKQLSGTSIYIGAPQRTDPIIMVTPTLNAPLNDPILLYDRTLNAPPNDPILPPKKARPTGRKTNRCGPSFCRKVSSARAAARTSRERRLAHRPGSIVTLEYPSQGRPVRGRNEACLEDSLGVSKAKVRRSRGIPTDRGIKPLDSIKQDQHPRPH